MILARAGHPAGPRPPHTIGPARLQPPFASNALLSAMLELLIGAQTSSASIKILQGQYQGTAMSWMIAAAPRRFARNMERKDCRGTTVDRTRRTKHA